MFENLFYFITVFFILLVVNLFPHFSQTKKNLLWLIFIFICVSIFMITDLFLEFLPLAYLLIYVGAVAVMFLFIIVAVDAKSENRIEWFESSILPALVINNFLTSIFYFIFVKPKGFTFNDINSFLLFKEWVRSKNDFYFKDFGSGDSVCVGCHKNEIIKNFYGDFIINSGCLYDNLSIYNLIEYKTKDIYVFSEYFFNFHGFLLVIVGFVLTVSMIVSLLIAKKFSKKVNEI